ncbi:DUF6049 family protein [[Mycobacterium] crassicus]|uniref:DUF6049 family protein n=1 Tax=[Mycobacterium] crassicus TaxID=2872309 RepID=A0ABU5XCN4_9MYCO|nr:DUF6049 family protein [Mycolicibacter sp. MYC098]MEB3020065.1 DUF6049 family protein [Mycolicibacter sp. MYC098]
MSGPLAALSAVIAALLLVLGAAGAPPAAAGEPDSTPFVRIRVDRVTPEVVTTSSVSVVTVAGTVRNVGDRPVRDVMVRLEGAGAVVSSAGLRTNLTGTNDQYRPVGTFTTVAEELQRGQEARFTLSAPLRSANQPALNVDRPGIYPLLVNVNGTPDYGEPARLDDARFLLPVTGLPKTGSESEPLAGAVAPDISHPVRLTMLWPLADRPRLTPGAPGGTLPVRLADDDLASSLAPGGRLDALLSAAEFATSPAVDGGGVVNRSLCLAIDPDLLVTVNAMTGGYMVADSPEGATSHPGTGQAAATTWLERLRRLANHTCVAASPYAQADLDTLARVGDPGLDATAVSRPADIVDRILRVTSTRGAVLLGDGRLTSGAADLIGAQGDAVVIAGGDCAAQDSGTGASATADLTPRRVSPQLVVAPYDPAVGAALAAMGTDPVAPTYLDGSLATRLHHDSALARRQNALGSMLWRALESPESPDTPRDEILMPPAYWKPRADDAQAVLTTLGTALRSGLAVPRSLTAVIDEARGFTDPLVHPLPAEQAVGGFGPEIVAGITGDIARLWGLTAALTTDVRTGLTGEAYTAPLAEDMLRALSQSEPPDVRNGLAAQRLGIVGNTVADLIGAVTIVNPAGSYTLATEHSPLPLALRNDLAVPIRVRLYVDAPPGMTVADVGELELPPGYLPLRVPVEVRVNQRFAVDVALQTPGGLALGESARLSVHSNAYGMVLFLITVTAAAVLTVLTARRLWHRFRGQPDRADLDGPLPPRPDHPHPPAAAGTPLDRSEDR